MKQYEQQALAFIDEGEWAQARRLNTIEAYSTYLRQAGGQNSRAAHEFINGLIVKIAENSNTTWVGTIRCDQQEAITKLKFKIDSNNRITGIRESRGAAQPDNFPAVYEIIGMLDRRSRQLQFNVSRAIQNSAPTPCNLEGRIDYPARIIGKAVGCGCTHSSFSLSPQ